MPRKFSLFAVAILALGLVASGAQAYENCNGVGYFALQVPDPAAVMVDGLDRDWAWFDPDFIVGPDQMCNTLGNPMPPKSDIDIAIKIGWTPEPDNRLYAFVKVVDDTLNADETNMDNGWNDDNLELILDPDHAGGWHEEAGALRTGHQQWTFSVSLPGGYPQIAWLRFNQPPEMQWAINEGLVEAAVNVAPEPASTIVPDVVVGYEVRMAAFDPYMPDGEAASVRHTFVANQTIGLSVTLDEADAAGRTDQLSTHIQEGGAHDSDFTSEFTLLGVGDYATAVEASSWGAVKALLR
jgi:hypothetical protein